MTQRSAATPSPTASKWIDPEYKLYGEVAAAFNSRAAEQLVAGAAGTGKTLANLLRVYWVCRKYPGARVLIVRKTRESLTESVLVTWERDILTPVHPILTTNPSIRRVRQSYRFPNGSEVIVGGIDKPGKILSSEYDLIYCPEVTDLIVEDWETLNGRLRAGRVPYEQMIADCNPTTPHFWLYQRCLRGGCVLFPTIHQDNPRFYDRATATWTEAGKKYMARLQRNTGSRLERFYKGNWVAAEGVVYEYNPKIHLLPADYPIPWQWKRVWGIDWGKTSPTVLQVWAVDPEGRMYLTREYYKTKLRPDRLAVWAKEQLELGLEPYPVAIVCDHDPERKVDFEKACGLTLELADKADRDKGIEAMQSRFDVQEDGRPRIFIKANCLANEPDRTLVDAGKPTCLVEELVGYVWDDNEKKDEPIDENDHACDSARYAARYVTANLSPDAIMGAIGVNPGSPILPAYMGKAGEFAEKWDK